MKANIEIVDGKLILRVLYDPALCNWDEAISAGSASFGLRHGQAAVSALPFPKPGGELCSLQEKCNKREKPADFLHPLKGPVSSMNYWGSKRGPGGII